MGIKSEIGQKIKIIRKKRGLTQEQLAEKVDISARAMSGIEVGEYFAKAETLDKIVEALDTTTEELFSNEHLSDDEKIYSFIIEKIEELKTDKLKLQLLYKIVKCLYNT